MSHIHKQYLKVHLLSSLLKSITQLSITIEDKKDELTDDIITFTGTHGSRPKALSRTAISIDKGIL